MRVLMKDMLKAQLGRISPAMPEADILRPCREMVRWLVPRLLGVKLSGESVEERKAAAQADGGAGIPREQLQGLMQDRPSSHLMEVRHSVDSLSPHWQAWAPKEGMRRF